MTNPLATRFSSHATCVMGILNITPDSFSDGGRYVTVEQATRRALDMVADGADVIDVGAESTRPGFTPLDWGTEWARLQAILPALVETNVPISVDTYHAETAQRALATGVRIVNDISFAADAEMVSVMRSHPDALYVLMHNRTHTLPTLSVGEIVEEVRVRIERVLDAGLHPNQLIVDPGVGFAKTQAQNLACIRGVDRFAQLGYPVLLGTSRKRVIGNVLSVPVDERLEGSLATVAFGMSRGVSIVRVHDVRETVRLCRMWEAIAGVS